MPRKKRVTKTPKKKQLKKLSRSRATGFRLYCIAMITIGFIGLHLTPIVPVSSQTNIQTTQHSIVPITIEHAAPPQHITIGDFIDQPIEEQFLSNGGMPTVSSDHVSYFGNSARPGDKGNMILYGHNKKQILGNLHSVRLGDVITVTATDGSVFQYRVTHLDTVETTNTSWLEQTDDAVITIYTCTGWMDSLRLVVRGELVS